MEEKKTHLVPAVCTQCGSALDVDPDQKTAVCPYCGTSFIVEKAINNYNTIHVQNEIHVQHGKKGVFQSAADLLNNQLEREHRAAIRQKELELEQQKINLVKEERRKENSRSFWKKVLWGLGWLFCFPVPLMILLNRKEDIDPKKKKIYIIAAWVGYALLLVLSRDSSADQKGTAHTTPAPVHENTPAPSKPLSTAFKNKSHRTITAGSYSFEIPETWNGTENVFLVENDGSKGQFVILTTGYADSVSYASDEEMTKDRKAIMKQLMNMKNVSDTRDGTVSNTVYGDTAVCYGSYHAVLKYSETESFPGTYRAAWMRDPSGKGITLLLLFESDDSAYSYEDDFTGILRSNTVVKDEGTAKPDESDASFEAFKQKMDAYEAFFDSYIEFMKTYDANDAAMLLKYMDMLSKYNEAMQALDAIDESTLTAKESAYYTEVMLRISKKNLELLEYLQ